MSTVNGVSEVRIFGQKPFAVHVQVNPAALAARGIGIEEVRTAIAQASVNRPKGNLTDAHQTVTLDTNDQIFDAAGYRKVVVAWRNGAPVRLGDIAEVSTACRTSAPAPGSRASAESFCDPARGRRQHDRGRRDDQGALPKLQESIPPSVHVDLVADRRW